MLHRRWDYGAPGWGGVLRSRDRCVETGVWGLVCGDRRVGTGVWGQVCEDRCVEIECALSVSLIYIGCREQGGLRSRDDCGASKCMIS